MHLKATSQTTGMKEVPSGKCQKWSTEFRGDQGLRFQVHLLLH